MGIRLSGIVIDDTDLDLLARFWSGLLGLEITRREDDWISLGPGLALQLVPEPKTVKNRIHLDLVADDFAEAVARAAELGATPVGKMQENLWQVWRDHFLTGLAWILTGWIKRATTCGRRATGGVGDRWVGCVT